jgi:hypothetical protein
MTWQEELRQLDSALAGGELSANEYRKRRDEILAAASSAQPPSAVIGPPGSARAAGEGDPAEVTQVVSIDETHSTELATEADQTQIISDPAGAAAAAERTQVVSQNGSGERTQMIPAVDDRTAPAVPQQQPTWATQLPDPNAQTGIFPHPQQPMPPGPAVTPLDAQDLFVSNKAPSGGKKPWLIALVLLVVLALAGGAVWFFGFRDSAPNTADDKKKNDQSEAAPPPAVDITKIELPGEAAANGGEMDITKAGELKVIAPAEAALLADAGVGPVVYSGSADGDYRYLLYSYESDDAAAAEELTSKIADVQKQMGFQDTKVDEVPDEVGVSAVSNTAAAAVRAVYTYGDTTIQLCVLQVPKGNEDDVRVQFQTALTAVTDAAPPTR